MENILMLPGNTPIWQLTIDQFMKLLKSCNAKESVDNQKICAWHFGHQVSFQLQLSDGT